MIRLFAQHLIPAAYAVLPAAMRSTEATGLLLTIGQQESSFAHRKQIGGPAMGAFQFEMNGVRGVLGHPRTSRTVLDAMAALNYRFTPTPHGCYVALEHNDVLAVVFARLLLWTLPGRLPGRGAPQEGWDQYVEAWRPGAAKDPARREEARARWSASWTRAWDTLDSLTLEGDQT